MKEGAENKQEGTPHPAPVRDSPPMIQGRRRPKSTYHDRTVLVAECKVKVGVNYIRFTKDPNRKGILYKVDGDRVREECEVTSNGKIKCFVVPLGWLEEVETKESERARESTSAIFRDVMEEMRT